jgi:hypothetical protein
VSVPVILSEIGEVGGLALLSGDWGSASAPEASATGTSAADLAAGSFSRAAGAAAGKAPLAPVGGRHRCSAPVALVDLSPSLRAAQAAGGAVVFGIARSPRGATAGLVGRPVGSVALGAGGFEWWRVRQGRWRRLAGARRLAHRLAHRLWQSDRRSQHLLLAALRPVNPAPGQRNSAGVKSSWGELNDD